MKYFRSITFVLCLCIASAALAESASNEVRKIIATQVKKPIEQLKPGSTFAALGADELDFVEIIMAVEEKLDITIEDDELEKVAKASSSSNLIQHLTIQDFVAFVEKVPKKR